MSDEHDPSEPAPAADDISAKRERREDAEGLIDPKSVFMLGVRGVRMNWFRGLMDARDQATKDELTYKLQVLDEVVNALNGFITDHKMALRNKR
jgi:hypothetical protein